MLICATETATALVLWHSSDQILCRLYLYFVFSILERFCETFNMHQKFFSAVNYSSTGNGSSGFNVTPSQKLAFEEKFLEVIIISSTKDCFCPHFQTPRRELKLWCIAEYFLQTFRCLEMWSISQQNNPSFPSSANTMPTKNGCISFRSKSLHLYFLMYYYLVLGGVRHGYD